MKSIKIMIVILLAIIAIPAAYLQWPKLTQTFRPGTCLLSEKSSEVFLVEGFNDNFKSNGVPAKYIKVNGYTGHIAGEKIHLTDGDKDLKKIDCANDIIE